MPGRKEQRAQDGLGLGDLLLAQGSCRATGPVLGFNACQPVPGLPWAAGNNHNLPPCTEQGGS